MSEPDRLIGPVELAARVCKSVLTVRKDVHRRPDTLPPRTILPGDARSLRWRESDVDAWLASLTTVQAPVIKRGPGRPPICLQVKAKERHQEDSAGVRTRRGRPPMEAQSGSVK